MALFMYGVYIREHYATDTYVILQNGLSPQHFINIGRLSIAAISSLLEMLSIETITAEYQSFFTILSILLFGISGYIAMMLFLNLRNNWDSISTIVLCLSISTFFFNVFYTDWYQYPEHLIFYAVGLLLAIYATKLLVCRKSPAGIIFSFLLLFVAINFYQSVGAHFVILSILYIYLKEDKKSFVKLTIEATPAFLIYVFVGIVNLVSLKLLAFETTDRSDISNTSITQNILDILSVQGKLWKDGIGILPSYFFIFVLILIISLYFVEVFYFSKKHLIFKTLILILILAISFIVIMAPHLFTNNVWMAQRTIPMFLGLPGIVGIMLAFITKKDTLVLQIKKLAKFALAMSLIIYFISTQFVASSLFSTNITDQEVVKLYYREVEKYERKTGIKVEYIATTKDARPMWKYKDVINSINMNNRALLTDWAFTPLMNFSTGRNFSPKAMDKDIYEQYFEGKNWDNFDPEQVVIVGNTAYIAIY